MPPQWRELLEQLGPVFARRSTFRLFTALACGLILADRGTVTGMAAAAGIGRQWRRACWFFSAAAWDPGALGLAVARMIVKYLLSEGEPVTVAVDGTFFRRWGKHVAEARWAYDGAAQGGKKIAFGNTWVVAALVVRLRFCPSPAALPVLFRLWRGKGTASQPQLAAQMVKELAEAFPGRVVHGTGDAAFHGESLVIQSATWTTRLPASAVLHGPKPPPTGKRGRPRAKGDRIGTCADAAVGADWREAVIRAYGQDTAVQVAARDALWYGSFKSAPGQLVLVREPGSKKPYDLGIFTLDTRAPGCQGHRAVLLAVGDRAVECHGQTAHRRRGRLHPHAQSGRAGRPVRIPHPVPDDHLVRPRRRPRRRRGEPPDPVPLVQDQGHALARRHAHSAAQRADRCPYFRNRPRSGQLPEKHPGHCDQRSRYCITRKHERGGGVK